MSASTEAASVSASAGSKSRRPAGSSAGLFCVSSLMSDCQVSGISRRRNWCPPGLALGHLPLVMPPARNSRAAHTMLFNSPEFVLGFLPAVLAGFFLIGRWGGTRWALRWLVAASFFFYGWWNQRFIL